MLRLGSGFREFSSLGNWCGWLESQLKQKPCLAGCMCSKLGFWFVVGVFPGRMFWLDMEVELGGCAAIGGWVFLVRLRPFA